MKEYTITGQRENIKNFVENADWGGIFREFHYTMEYSRMDDNTIILSFGIGKHPTLGYMTDKILALTDRMVEECNKFNLNIG